jgi:hypothetical protein
MADTQTKPMTWQAAVEELLRERTRAESCVGVLMRYGEPAAVAQGALAYGEAKAEYDGVISGLVMALAQKGQPQSLDDLQARLRRGFDKRAAFCRSVLQLVPSDLGQKGVLGDGDPLGAVAEPLSYAVVAIWSRVRDDKVLVRKTIQNQLEATAWPTFDKVS